MWPLEPLFAFVSVVFELLRGPVAVPGLYG